MSVCLKQYLKLMLPYIRGCWDKEKDDDVDNIPDISINDFIDDDSELDDKVTTSPHRIRRRSKRLLQKKMSQHPLRRSLRLASKNPSSTSASKRRNKKRRRVISDSEDDDYKVKSSVKYDIVMGNESERWDEFGHEMNITRFWKPYWKRREYDGIDMALNFELQKRDSYAISGETSEFSDDDDYERDSFVTSDDEEE